MKRKRFAADCAQCAVFAALMCVSAYISIPFQPVPLTFQTVISVCAGLLLGWRKGIAAMSAYVFMGLVGIPVFAAGGGLAYVLKPSFGYIIGFIAAAGTGGAIAQKTSLKSRRYVIAAICAFAANYIIGIPYCIIAAHLLGVSNLTGLLITGNLIYMPKDFVLCLLASFLARRVAPYLRTGDKSMLKGESGGNAQ